MIINIGLVIVWTIQIVSIAILVWLGVSIFMDRKGGAPIKPQTNSNINAKRYDLATLHLYNSPKTTYIRCYLHWVNDNDPNWKTDFLAFCKKNNIGLDKEDIDKLALLV